MGTGQQLDLQPARRHGDAPGLKPQALGNGQVARLQLAKSYVGGIDGTTTEQTTGSGPGWTTILTGSWVDRHKVPSNNDEWRNQAPSVFKQLKLADPQRKTASIVSWNTINHNFTDDIANGYIDLAVDCALRGEPGVIGQDEENGDVLSAIAFDRIKGGKPFDITQDWYLDLLAEIGQPAPVAAPPAEH